MNLTQGLGFPDPLPETENTARTIARRTGLEGAIERFQEWMADPDSPVRAIKRQEARAGIYAEFPESLSAPLKKSLAARGIQRLYSHQAQSFEHATAGHNVVVVTPTASGKTLCYNLPVMNRLINEPGARAIYLFPTKALAEDQLQAFNESGSELKAFTYDGDTPQDARRAIRERANVVLTNPDMLHAGILPHHTKWAKAFENLRYVVIDELHTYRGVYGSHLANVLRRLKRICEFYGSSPQFICCSATIANPKELAEALTGLPFELVSENGAPSGEKYVVFYNPPVVNRALGIRRGYLNETRRIARELIDRGQQTLVFANSRLATEVLLTYLKDDYSGPSNAVRGYRGGYLPKERREIEAKLRDGDIRAVVATNALELGVDIGSLDAVVMAGYPGTIASTWQRAGRAGRRQTTSLAVMVASSAPLDQYIIEHPEYFFDRPPEHAFINPDNLEILLNHLKCAAFELPIRDGEIFGKNNTGELCQFLSELKLLHHSGPPTNGMWHWTSDTYPADAISLRSITSDNFVVVDITGDHKIIATVSFTDALDALHEKAIYLHEARQYQVERFDYEGRKAYVRRIDSDYFTDAIDYTQVKELDEFESTPIGQSHDREGAGPSEIVRVADLPQPRAAHGDVRLNRQIVGFKKVKFYTMENVGAGNLAMPEQEMHTTAFWLHFPAEFLARFSEFTPTEKQAGLVGLGALLKTVGSLLVMCDARDLGVSITEAVAGSLQTFEPNLYLYDNYPGGIGQSAALFRLTSRLLSGAASLLRSCPCEAGCPSCVGPIGAIGERGKEVAGRILAELIG